jgi:hypothetical protein
MPEDVSTPHAAQAPVDMTVHSNIKRKEGCWEAKPAHSKRSNYGFIHEMIDLVV